MNSLFKGIGVSISNQDLISQSVKYAKTAEENNFSSVFLPERVGGRSGLMTAMAIAQNTNKIDIGVGIITPYIRELTSIAMDSLSINEVSKGRFMLGLGAPIWKIADYGITLKKAKPLSRMRDAYTLLKELMQGKETSFESEYFGIPKGIKIKGEGIPYRKDIPIFFGVINKKMLELIGEIADFVHLGAMTHPTYAKWAIDQISIGAKRADRDMADFPIYANVMTALDDDPNKALDAARPGLGLYLSIVEHVMYKGLGISDEIRNDLRKTYSEQGWEAATAKVTDEMVEKIACVGTAEDVIKGYEEILETGITYPTMWYGFGKDKEASIRKLGKEVLPHLPVNK
ncbi:MAG: LLM class flavin-dependent oxidoreductase [Candidatus Ranarchaeia archaeon]